MKTIHEILYYEDRVPTYFEIIINSLLVWGKEYKTRDQIAKDLLDQKTKAELYNSIRGEKVK